MSLSSPVVQTASSPFPSRIGRYELLAPIAVGGTATVFVARTRGARGFEREVAVKLLHAHLRISSHTKDAAAELMEEAKLAARMRHPNIVPVLDVGDDAAGIYLVMEYIEGTSLAALLQNAVDAGRPLDTTIALRILTDAFLGLEAAHALRDERGQPLNLIHRDFSPQNILVGLDGVARLTDFGIARATSRAEFTRTGVVKGKVAYMAPEQAQGLALDQRCDVWAAGVVAWEVLAGQPLYRGTDPMATMLRIVSETPPRLRAVRPDVPPEVDEAIAWALQPDMAQRCPSAKDLRLRLLGAWAPTAMPADFGIVGEKVGHVAAPRLAEIRKAADDALASRSKRSKLSALATPRRIFVLAAALGGIGIGVASALRPAPEPKNQIAPPSRGTAASAPDSAPAPSPPPPPAVVRRTFLLRADRPIRQIRIGSRTIVVDPSRELTVELLPRENTPGLRVDVVSDDGRRAGGKLTALDVSLDLRFPAASRVRANHPRAIPKPPVPGLAPSPY